MPDGGNSVRKGRKFDAVLDGARQVFLSDGYEGATVDDIARVAGVSKATLYSYFPDKAHLFMEIAMQECQRQADAVTDSIDTTRPVAAVLHDAAMETLGFITSEFGQRVFRLCVAESVRFPELGQRFYESGPLMVRGRLVAYFAEAVARGELKMSDPDLAADQFHELCKADVFARVTFNVATDFTTADLDRVAKGAVETFLARYGT